MIVNANKAAVRHKLTLRFRLVPAAAWVVKRVADLGSIEETILHSIIQCDWLAIYCIKPLGSLDSIETGIISTPLRRARLPVATIQIPRGISFPQGVVSCECDWSVSKSALTRFFMSGLPILYRALPNTVTCQCKSCLFGYVILYYLPFMVALLVVPNFVACAR